MTAWAWRNRHDDGTTFDSNDGEWENAPIDGLAVIAVPGLPPIRGGDYYVRNANGIIRVIDKAEIEDYILGLGELNLDLGDLKKGIRGSDDEFQVIWNRAQSEFAANDAPAWGNYYLDGSRYTANDGTWRTAPGKGVALVVRKVGETITPFYGKAHYRRFADGTIADVDLGPYLRSLRTIKVGRQMSDTDFEVVLAQAIADLASV